MAYTKRQFVTAALEEIGLASYIFDAQPEQLQSALVRLDAMMANWNGKGIRLAYPLPGTQGASSLDEDTSVPDSANEAVITNLAVRLAPSYGKTVSPDTKAIARDAYNLVLSRSTMPPEMQLPDTMPAGAGNKQWNVYGTYINPPSDPVLTGGDGVLEFD
jgi:hypothetical protein